MKKRVIFGIIITVLLTVGIITQANYTGEITGVRGNYPIFVDGQQVEQDLSMVLIEDRIYLPIRALCNILQIDIGWTEEQTAEITTNKSDKFNVGYNGKNGWVTTGTPEFELSKETAMAIADDVFLQIKGEEYISKTGIKILESDDKSCYRVFRHNIPLTPGGDITVEIRKSDGKIMKVELGE